MMKVGNVLLMFLGIALMAGTAEADLVGHWAFDEGSGTVATDSVNGLDGILWEGPAGWGGTLPEWTVDRSGNPGKALLFSTPSGENWNSVYVAHDPLLDLTTDWTLALWARQDDNSGEWTGIWARYISCPNYEFESGGGRR